MLVFGFVALIAAVVLLSPPSLATLARVGRGAPIAVRLALRDLARYRARSGPALAGGWLLAGREPPGVAHQPIQ